MAKAAKKPTKIKTSVSFPIELVNLIRDSALVDSARLGLSIGWTEQVGRLVKEALDKRAA